ncbi:MAG: hypothetical protein IPG60_07835 [Bacteroidetes bacterium]|nr:hypothetical protein [Bacteroidota bacterium]MBP7398999.1 hypothetical protein [Chitinophagales bacterium]MBK7110663.1 hypothetical protein [Bacteroidota bacterium]MBK8488116.1 hypothetical protein [Bacteroidota bacterium]MBK8682125.1 hypothetical protein [Bacteroidota bacterium]
MKLNSILVISRGKASLGRMFQGYLQYFNKGDIQITVASTDIRTIHPLALDVMFEDGIELNQNLTVDFNKNILKTFDYIYILGYVAPEIIESLNGIPFEQYEITDPLKSDSYLNTLERYHTAREEIKKICIDLAGSFNLVKS